jgi:Methylamine utilisation protein MauE
VLTTLARLGLAVVLAAAALGKLRDRDRAAGPLPGALVVPLALAEAALGAWLASGLAVTAAALAAGGLLGAFAAGLVILRARGERRLRCACFGRGGEHATLLLAGRAAVLALLAVAVALPPPRPSLVVALAIAVAVLALAVAGLALLLLALYRQVGTLALRVAPRTPLELEAEGPPLGMPAPALAGVAAEGSELVAFLGVGCRVCGTLEPSLRALDREALPVHVVWDVDDPAALERWGVPGTPFVVHVVDGIVAAKGLANTLEELEHLVAAGTARMAHVPA